VKPFVACTFESSRVGLAVYALAVDARPRVDVDVRLAELVASLSLATDLGRGQPLEHTVRQTLIALRLADLLGFGDDDRMAVYYTGLLVSV
jgi:hypothetical protein